MQLDTLAIELQRSEDDVVETGVARLLRNDHETHSSADQRQHGLRVAHGLHQGRPDARSREHALQDSVQMGRVRREYNEWLAVDLFDLGTPLDASSISSRQPRPPTSSPL
jgi:hypothetical protein